MRRAAVVCGSSSRIRGDPASIMKKVKALKG
jgi:hypothetical protein